MAHTCNPSYLEGRDQEDQGPRPAWANSSQDSISTNKKLSVVLCVMVCACHSRYVGNVNRAIMVQVSLGIKVRQY
jgi:hypothetical protein